MRMAAMKKTVARTRTLTRMAVPRMTVGGEKVETHESAKTPHRTFGQGVSPVGSSSTEADHFYNLSSPSVFQAGDDDAGDDDDDGEGDGDE
jgi:hypothetical protein